MNNFKLTACDTDSIFFKKQDGSYFSVEERKNLLNEINSLMPEKIKWEHNSNDYFKKIINVKTKNYILQTEDGTVKIKGSSLKDQKKEPALLEFIGEIINTMLDEKYEYLKIYDKYVKETLNVKDIKRWASKKTITSKVLEGTRTNETKVKDAINDSEYKEGDKIWTYFTQDDSLKLVENYNNDHNVDKLLEKLYKTAQTFVTIIPKETFLNYKLKKNKMLLGELK